MIYAASINFVIDKFSINSVIDNFLINFAKGKNLENAFGGICYHIISMIYEILIIFDNFVIDNFSIKLLLINFYGGCNFL